MAQGEGVSWEDLMAFNEQILVHLGWTRDKEEEDGNEDLQLVAETGKAEDACGNMQ